MLLKIIEKIVLFDWTDRNSNIFYLHKIKFNSPGNCRIPYFEENVHKPFQLALFEKAELEKTG
jgi:hypothetical protein